MQQIVFVHYVEKMTKHYCALGIGLELGFGLELAEICFRSNVFSSKCSRSKQINSCFDHKSQIVC